MKENKEDTQLRSAEDILKNFIRKETEYLQACNRTNALGEITSNDFAAGVIRGMNKVLEEYASQFRSVSPEAEKTIESNNRPIEELWIEEYYGMNPDKVNERTIIRTDYGDLTSLLTSFKEKHFPEVESKETFSDWISVKDQLPKEGQHVLCHNGIRMVENSWEEYTDQDQEWFKETFTHWMPLPNPPKP